MRRARTVVAATAVALVLPVGPAQAAETTDAPHSTPSVSGERSLSGTASTELRREAGTRAVRRIRLGGVRVTLRRGTSQVVTVNRRRGYHATVTFWARSGGRWHAKVRTTSGRIGYGGLVAGGKRRQGTGTTPTGSYTMTESFGTSGRPRGTSLPFHRVRPSDYWVQDNASRFYNTLRSKHAGGFRWWLPSSNDNASERLRDYRSQYRWSIVVDFNRPPNAVRWRGSGIFLHVNGRGATAGCVSASRRFIRRTMSRLSPARVPVIAIGP